MLQVREVLAEYRDNMGDDDGSAGSAAADGINMKEVAPGPHDEAACFRRPRIRQCSVLWHSMR
jgi:hypothetical protein